MNGSFNPDLSVATGKNRIVSLVMPNVATIIAHGFDDSIFQNFSNLKSVSGANIDTIGYSAFISCTSLQNVSFPQATTIYGSAFEGCTSLQNVSFPQVTQISGYAFENCLNLQSVNFPQATTINDYAFKDCTSLQNVNLPASVTLDGSPFFGCTSLVSFTLSGTGNLSGIENGKALVRNGTTLIAYPSASGAITMNTITVIDGAFSGCTGLQSVNFPQATSISAFAFSSCTGLQSVNFPQVTSIDSYAFRGCTGLQSLNIPKVTSIGTFAFIYTGNATLSITTGPAAPTLANSIFYGITSAKTVMVKIPSGATGYTPFSGSTVTLSGTDTTANWGNGFRGGGWNGTTWDTGGGTTYINQNISLIIERQ